MALRCFLPLVQIVLVVVFGGVEGHDGTDLRGGMVAHLHEFAKNLDGRVALREIVEPNGGEVLCADVHALSVGLLKVVDFKEIAHQGLVGNHIGIVFHRYGLQMSRQARLDLLVARVFHVAAHVADGGSFHAFEPLEIVLHAPKATC